VLTGPANIGGEAPLTDTTVTYYISDHLNSARMLLAAAGWPTSSSTFYPFGQEQVATSTPNNYKFTGKERDTESGLDYFGARYYGSSMGRFMSPDPMNAGAEESDPQSWNGYAYVGNNPLANVDPTGEDYYYLGGSQCGQNGVNCDSQGYVLGADGNRYVIHDQDAGTY